MELELEDKIKKLEEEHAEKLGGHIDLSLSPIRIMREFLRRRQVEDSGVTGISIWAESHAAIHTWDEDNFTFLSMRFPARTTAPKTL